MKRLVVDPVTNDLAWSVEILPSPDPIHSIITVTGVVDNKICTHSETIPKHPETPIPSVVLARLFEKARMNGGVSKMAPPEQPVPELDYRQMYLEEKAGHERCTLKIDELRKALKEIVLGYDHYGYYYAFDIARTALSKK